MHGEAQVRYRARLTDDAEKHDLYTTLALDVGDVARHRFTAHMMGRAWFDLGGDDPNDLFFGPEDSFGSPHGLLYYGYVDAHRVDSFETIRISRQQIWDTPAFVVFDGLRLEPKELGAFFFGAYGGLRAEYYDESGPDEVAGAYGETRPSGRAYALRGTSHAHNAPARALLAGAQPG